MVGSLATLAAAVLALPLGHVDGEGSRGKWS